MPDPNGTILLCNHVLNIDKLTIVPLGLATAPSLWYIVLFYMFFLYAPFVLNVIFDYFGYMPVAYNTSVCCSVGLPLQM